MASLSHFPITILSTITLTVLRQDNLDSCSNRL